MGLYGNSCTQWDSPGETIPRARLAKLPSLALPVIGLVWWSTDVVLQVVLLILGGGLLVCAVSLIGAACFLILSKWSYDRAIKERARLREANFWTAMDNVIAWQLPEPSPELAELERVYAEPVAQALKDCIETSRAYEGNPGSWRPAPNHRPSKRRARRKANRERYQQVLAIYRRHHHCEQEPCRHKPSSGYLREKLGVAQKRYDEAHADAIDAIRDVMGEKVAATFMVPEQQMGQPPSAYTQQVSDAQYIEAFENRVADAMETRRY